MSLVHNVRAVARGVPPFCDDKGVAQALVLGAHVRRRLAESHGSSSTSTGVCIHGGSVIAPSLLPLRDRALWKLPESESESERAIVSSGGRHSPSYPAA